MKKIILMLLFSISVNAQLLTLMSDDESTAIDTSGASRVYFVDAVNGNDANNGLSGLRAWKTWDNISSTDGVNGGSFQSGDSILFRKGNIYSRSVASGGFYLQTMDSVYFGSYGSGAKPIIDGVDDFCLYVSWQAQTHGWCTDLVFDDLHFIVSDDLELGERLVKDFGYNNVSLTTNVTFQNCLFDGDGVTLGEQRELLIWNGEYLTVDNCIFQNSYSDGVYSGGNYQTVTNSTFNNVGHSASSEGGISSTAGAMNNNLGVKGWTITNNHFIGAYYNVRLFSVYDSTLVSHNVFDLRSDSSTVNVGIMMQNTSGNGIGSNNIKIYNNTFLVDGEGKTRTVPFWIDDSSGYNVDIRNNLVKVINDSAQSFFYYQTDALSDTARIDNNLYFSDDTNSDGWAINYSASTTLGTWQTRISDDLYSNYADPFLDTDDFTLSAGSPAINTGIKVYDWNGNALTSDKNGNVYVGRPDIGAIETSTTDTTDYSLTFDGINDRVYYNGSVATFEYDSIKTLRLRFEMMPDSQLAATTYLGAIGHCRIQYQRSAGTPRLGKIKIIPDNEQSSGFYTTSSYLEPDVWHDIEIVFNLSMSYAQIYINGILDNDVEGGTNTLNPPDWADANGQWLSLGDFSYSTGFNWKGALKNVRISCGSNSTWYKWTPTLESADDGNNSFTLTADGGIF